MLDFEVLIDADALVGLFVEPDAHHQHTVDLFKQLAQKRTKIVITSYTIVETATVISRLSGQNTACRFLDYVASQQLPIIHIDEALQAKALKIFATQDNKKTSAFDCANVAVMRQYGIPQIFSFDAVYDKKFGLTMLT